MVQSKFLNEFLENCGKEFGFVTINEFCNRNFIKEIFSTRYRASVLWECFIARYLVEVVNVIQRPFSVAMIQFPPLSSSKLSHIHNMQL